MQGVGLRSAFVIELSLGAACTRLTVTKLDDKALMNIVRLRVIGLCGVKAEYRNPKP